MLELMNWNGVEVIDSRVVAEAVGKEHKELMRTIRTYIQHLAESNFGLSENNPSQDRNLDESIFGSVENSPSQSHIINQRKFAPVDFFINLIGGTGNE